MSLCDALGIADPGDACLENGYVDLLESGERLAQQRQRGGLCGPGASDDVRLARGASDLAIRSSFDYFTGCPD